MSPETTTAPATRPTAHGVAEKRGLFDREILGRATIDAVRKLDPRTEIRNPVMFVVLIGAIVTFIESIAHPGIFTWSVTIWLFLTVVFANFAEAVAEGRGKAQADTLRKMRAETEARLLGADGVETRVPAAELVKGNVVVCEAGDIIPSDGEIIEGVASVDESAITGESAPVIRESGGDRSAVTGGTKVLSDRILVRITAERGHTFLDRMISLVEGASRQKTPNEIALTILLAALTIIFLPVVVVLEPFGHYAGASVSVVVLVALLVCLIPTTIGALLSAIGIAGMDRLVQRNVLAMSGRVGRSRRRRPDPAARQDRHDHARQPDGVRVLAGRRPQREGRRRGGPAGVARRRDAGGALDRRARQGALQHSRAGASADHEFIPFSAMTRMSGLDVGGRQIRKGAADSIRQWVTDQGGTVPPDLDGIVERIARAGSTPLVVADGPTMRRRHRAERHREGGHPGAVRRDAGRWASAPS